MDNFISETAYVDLDVLDGFDQPEQATQEEPVISNAFKDNSVEASLDNIEKPEITEVPKISQEETEQILAEVENEFKEPAEEPKTEEPATGRPKTNKDSLIDYLATHIENQNFGVPEDYDTNIPVKDYLGKLPEKELHALLDTNWRVKEEEIKQSAPREFYEALPEEVRIVAEYAAKGGNDWKGLFQSLSKQEEVRQYDISKEDDHAPIVTQYLQESTQLTPQQIQEQVQEWVETGKIGQKAEQFKPSLDAIQEQRAKEHLRIAEIQRQKDQEVSDFYVSKVEETLSKNELAGIKLDKRFVADMYEGMTGVAPGPWSGRPVNKLGYLIEQKSFIEPDYEALMLATWVMEDKENFLKTIQQVGVNKGVNDSVRLIKLEQGSKVDGSGIPTPQKTVKRLPNNSRAFKR